MTLRYEISHVSPKTEPHYFVTHMFVSLFARSAQPTILVKLKGRFIKKFHQHP